MFAFKTILVLAAPLMAIANPLAVRTDPPTVCNTGSAQCCKTVQKASDPTTSGLLGLLGLLGLGVVADALVGLNCNPITVIGTGATNCQNTPVCCTNNQFSGLIALGCAPINVNL